jgi:hypothetical protein
MGCLEKAWVELVYLTNSYLIRNSFFDKLITDENLQEFLTLVATTI